MIRFLKRALSYVPLPDPGQVFFFVDEADGMPKTKDTNGVVTTLKGDQGDAATIAVGTVTTGAPGSSASVTNVGTSGAAVFDITIPRGDPGAGNMTGPVSSSVDELVLFADIYGQRVKAGGVVVTAAGKALLDDVDAAAQRATLALGDSATKNTGTAAGTVAAGDHSHSGTYEPANANIQAHVSSTSNPHSVTAAQVGADITTATVHAATSKTTPIDADEFTALDSANSFGLIRTTFANLKAALKTYFDGFYALVAANNTFTKAQRGSYTTLTDAATVAIDLSANNFFKLLLGGSRTLGAPSNIVEGQSGQIDVYQDGTGSRSLAFSWPYQFAGGTAPTLSTAKYAKDILAYTVNLYKQPTITVTIATPGVVSWTGHGLYGGQRVQITTTGALPTGLSASTSYYVIPVDANSFQLATSLSNAQAGTAIATSGSQSGTHTMTACTITIAALGDVK